MIHLSPAATIIIIMSLFLSLFGGGILLFSKYLAYSKEKIVLDPKGTRKGVYSTLRVIMRWDEFQFCSQSSVLNPLELGISLI